MQKGKIVVGRFVPPNQHAPKAIHPTMRALHYPASGFKADVPFDRLGFFATSPDVGREAKLPQRLAHFLIVVPFVQTQALRALLGRAWAFHHQTVHGLFD
jgi:hypothetical protein